MVINPGKVRTYSRLFLAVAFLLAVGISLTYCGDGGGAGGGVGTNSAIMERALSSFASALYRGYLNQATCTGIWGWAWDANNPTSTVSVDVYDGSTKLTTVAANQYVASLAAAGIGNGYHAFSYVPSFTDGKTHTINVYYSGTTTALSGSPMTTPTTCGNVSYHGYLNQATCTGIYGWAWEPGNPNSAINVDIYDGTTFLTTAAANEYGADLLAAGIGNGYHDFSYNPNFTDGKAHTVTVYYSGTTTNLSGSPMQTSTCSGSSVSYQGYLNGASCTGIWGWAWEPGNPGATVSVDIYNGNTILAAGVPANVYRADLAAAGIGNGDYSFSYVPSSTAFDNGQAHTVTVYYSGTTTNLSGSSATTGVCGSTGSSSSSTTTTSSTGSSSVSTTTIPSGIGIGSVPTTTIPSGPYSISGTVALSNGSPIAGVQLTLCLASVGIISAETTTDAHGNYTFTGLSSDQFVITPNETGYTFSLYAYTLTLNGQNVSGINFTGAVATGYSVSGYVQGYDANDNVVAIQGVTVVIGGEVYESTITDSNGYWLFTDLPNGFYIVTPGYDDHQFGPTDTTFTINGANINYIDFFPIDSEHNH